MPRGLVVRLCVFAGLTLAAIFYLIPSLVRDLPAEWTGFLPADRIHLGLDLQGGSHLVLEVQADKAVENALDRTREDLARLLKERGIPFEE